MVLSNLLGWESANHRSVAAAKHKLVPHLSNSTTVQWYKVILTQLAARPAGLSNRKASFLSVDVSCSQDNFTGIVVVSHLRKMWTCSGQFPKKSKNYNISHTLNGLYVESIIVTSLHFPPCSHPHYSQRYNSVIASDWSGTVFVYTNQRSSVFSTLDLKHSQSKF